ncbi:hypothetical protein V492_07554 [Pseudogymnoascus sp. VKM F-4246]|nr:hypothetical protein V492_07554 [Pseudogymnoascus sp. VKM F-4246]
MSANFIIDDEEVVEIGIVLRNLVCQYAESFDLAALIPNWNNYTHEEKISYTFVFFSEYYPDVIPQLANFAVAVVRNLNRDYPPFTVEEIQGYRDEDEDDAPESVIEDSEDEWETTDTEEETEDIIPEQFIDDMSN